MKSVHLYGWPIDYDPYDIWTDQEIDLGDYDSYEEARAAGEQMVREGKISKYDTYVI